MTRIIASHPSGYRMSRRVLSVVRSLRCRSRAARPRWLPAVAQVSAATRRSVAVRLGRVVLYRFVLGRLVLTRLTGLRLRSGDGLNLRRGLCCRRGSRSGCANSAPRSWVAESVEATCVCETGFDPNKAPNNLLANEPSLSAQGTGGSCGSSRSSRQHYRKWYYDARELGEENLVHSAVESAVDWGD